MHRFFVSPTAINGDHARIEGSAAHQIARVLRMQTGDHITLLDGLGFEYVVTLATIGKDEAIGRVESSAEGKGEPRHQITLYMSLLNKADKFEWALQKCTELGAAAFVPVRSARSIADMPGEAKMERWHRIVLEAAEQSGRAKVPLLLPAQTLQEALSEQRTTQAIIPALEARSAIREVMADRKDSKLSIFIGPEGGFTSEEVHDAATAGVVPVSLGPRVLRAETAAVAALTMALYEFGEMDMR